MNNHICRIVFRPGVVTSALLWFAIQTAEADWTFTGSMQTGRAFHTATLLSNGQVLVAGGMGVTNEGIIPFTLTLSSAELYDPVAGTWSAAGSMETVRDGHTATLLTNGEVLVTGGFDGTNALSSAELYDPATQTWTNTGSMITPRFSHAATLLQNGKVLVAGGDNSSGAVSSAELYDPVPGTWTAAASLSAPRYSHTATLLSDGTVLVAGGGNGTAALSSAERFNPNSNIWTPTGSMANPRQQHTATLLWNGKVLVAGGVHSTATLTSAELYDPVAGTWTATGSMATGRAAHTATLWPGGQVLVTGGFQLSGFDEIALSTVELFDPSAGTWTTISSLKTNVYSQTATLLTNLDLLVVGGTSGSYSYTASAELLPPPVFSQANAGLLGAYELQVLGGAVGAGYPSSAAWGDFDNDGLLDIIMTGTAMNAPTIPRTFPLWHNTGNGFTNIVVLHPKLESAIAPGDFNNDGLLDVVDDTSGIWRNTGSDFTANAAILSSVGVFPSAYGSVAWGDYDNDGRPDLLASGYTGAPDESVWTTNSGLLWNNTANAGFLFINGGPPGVYYGTVAWGDYDGDGRPDILLTGIDPTGKPITQVWRNTGNGFTNINAGLPGVAYGSAAWGDYDNDGLLDILLTGATNLIVAKDGSGTFRLGPFETFSGSSSDGETPASGNPTGYITQVWRNTGNGFTNINAGLPGVWAGSAAWGDYDNDGRLDILLTGATNSFIYVNPSDIFLPTYTDYVSFASGFISQVWRNTGTGFTNINADLPGVGYGSAAWGDYDNDGRLDILLTGATAVDSSGNITSAISQIWRNNSPVVNTPPSAPTGLTATLAGSSVVFSWNPASDAQTPASGLSYNLRVGTTPGGGDLVGPMADSTGLRRVPQMGNAQENLFRAIVGLPLGRPIYWSVQAVDTAFAGSPFATEHNFAFNTVFTPSNGVPVPGDLNGDGVVSESELAAVLANLNGNGMVNQSELDLVLSNYWPYSPWLYLTNVAGLGGTNVTFALTNSIAGNFSVEYTTNLVDWNYLGPAIPQYLFIDTNAPAVPERFYRLRWP